MQCPAHPRGVEKRKEKKKLSIMGRYFISWKHDDELLILTSTGTATTKSDIHGNNYSPSIGCYNARFHDSLCVILGPNCHLFVLLPRNNFATDPFS